MEYAFRKKYMTVQNVKTLQHTQPCLAGLETFKRDLSSTKCYDTKTITVGVSLILFLGLSSQIVSICTAFPVVFFLHCISAPNRLEIINTSNGSIFSCTHWICFRQIPLLTFLQMFIFFRKPNLIIESWRRRLEGT